MNSTEKGIFAFCSTPEEVHLFKKSRFNQIVTDQAVPEYRSRLLDLLNSYLNQALIGSARPGVDVDPHFQFVASENSSMLDIVIYGKMISRGGFVEQQPLWESRMGQSIPQSFHDPRTKYPGYFQQQNGPFLNSMFAAPPSVPGDACDLFRITTYSLIVNQDGQIMPIGAFTPGNEPAKITKTILEKIFTGTLMNLPKDLLGETSDAARIVPEKQNEGQYLTFGLMNSTPVGEMHRQHFGKRVGLQGEGEDFTSNRRVQLLGFDDDGFDVFSIRFVTRGLPEGAPQPGFAYHTEDLRKACQEAYAFLLSGDIPEEYMRKAMQANQALRDNPNKPTF